MRFIEASKILEEIDQGSLMLPQFQRNFVWKKPDIKEFIDSVYREYPVGALATWESDKLTEGSSRRSVYLLDGQQRLTSIYGVIRGSLPPFSSYGDNLMSGLLFHVKDRKFAYAGTKDVRDHADGLWVDVSRLFQPDGVKEQSELIREKAGLLMDEVADYRAVMDRLVERLNKVQFPVLELSDSNLTVEDVVNIFNKMNKGGKKLTPYELAFSLLSAKWPEVRADFQKAVDGWKGRMDGDINWLLRVVNAVSTKSGRLSIEKVPIDDVTKNLDNSKKAIDHLLNQLSSRLGLDEPRVLKQRLPFAVMTLFVVQQGGRIKDPKQRDKLLYWYVLSSVFGTYLRAPESRMTRDLNTIDGRGMDGIDALIESLRQDRPDLRIVPGDLDGTHSSSGFYTILYMLTRVHGAKDWQTGEPLRHGMYGNASKLQIHHIFPKKVLSDAKVQSKRINNLANFAFQTSLTNQSIGKKAPADYLPEIAEKFHGALESQWIPMERSRWQISEYESFLQDRRVKLAEAANQFLDSLRDGSVPEEVGSTVDEAVVSQVVQAEDDITTDRDALIEEFEVYASGVRDHPVSVSDRNQVYLDVAWPSGLQDGISEPVAFLFYPDEDVILQASQAGFMVFTDQEQLRHYARSIEGGEEDLGS